MRITHGDLIAVRNIFCDNGDVRLCKNSLNYNLCDNGQWGRTFFVTFFKSIPTL